MKQAVVVGGTGGVGSKLSKRLSKEGYEVTIVSRTAKKEEGIRCDLSKVEDVELAINRLLELEKIDLLVQAAGVATYKNLDSVSDREVQDAFMINVISPAMIIRDLLGVMKGKRSLVLSLGSGAGKIPMRGRSVYCATKFALRGLSLSLSEEFRDKRPRFCHVTLGSTLTDFGGKSAEEKQALADQGRAYFPVEFVVDKLMEIVADSNPEDEVVLYPSEYGFGDWKKP